MLQTAAASTAPAGSGALGLLLLILIAGAWIGLRWLMRSARAHAAERVLGAGFAEFALEALANAARIDGRIADTERAALVAAMREIAGAGFDAARAESALAHARLSQMELLDYLRMKANTFSREQKTHLLRALLQLVVADGKFEEAEHAALVDYTEAVGFDRKSAPEMLRGLARDVTAGRIV